MPPQRPVIVNPGQKTMSEQLFGNASPSVFDSGPKKLAKKVASLLGMDDPPDPASAAMDFANPMGAVIGRASRLAPQVIRTLSGETVPRGIRAYHGSPHLPFNRFDMNQIGTGEGAQAYGHGLYFAENEGVARSYRGGNRTFQVGDETLSSPLGKLLLARPPSAAAMTSRFPQVTGAVPGQQTFQNTAAGALDIAIERGDKNPAASAIDRLGYERQLVKHNRSDEYDRAIELIREWDRSGAQYTKGGSLSEVNLRVRPEELLDWDNPLGKQSASVQERLEILDPDQWSPRGYDYDAAETGSSIYHRLYSDKRHPTLGGIPLPWNRGRSEAQAAASEEMRKVGIPGLRYLDQASRPGGEGTRNIVMFDDEKIDIVKQLMLLLGIGAPAAAGAMQQKQEPRRPSMGSIR
jgi:hypothetical protein